MNVASPALDVVAVGARSPVGLDALQTAMCARASKLEPRETELRDRHGWPVALCLVGGVGAMHGHDRLVGLAAPALAEACTGVAAEIPLVLALAEPGRADDDPRFARDVVHAIGAAAGVSLDRKRSACVCEGNAGFASALGLAAQLFEDPSVPAVVVGGVDSWFHPGVLQALDASFRLHAPTTENGFIPSEGAAFCLLARRPPRRGDSPFGAPLARLGPARTTDEDTVCTGEPDVARALTEAVEQALSGATAPVGVVLSDVNGERHRVIEWARVRLRAELGQNVASVRVPDLLGDVGAASGALMMVLATQWWRVGCGAGRAALCTVASEGARRGAWLVEAP